MIEDVSEAQGTHRPQETNRPPSERVITEVADAEGVEPWDLGTPLFEAIDPDALDDLCAPATSIGAPAISVTFTYLGYSVSVTDDAVSVAPR